MQSVVVELACRVEGDRLIREILHGGRPRYGERTEADGGDFILNTTELLLAASVKFGE